jgi:hypothetical protein
MLKVFKGVFILCSSFLFISCFKTPEGPTLEQQKSEILEFLQRKGLTAQQTSSGYYYLLLSSATPPSTRTPKTGEQVTLNLLAKYLDDTTIPESRQLRKLPFGASYINKNIEDVLALSKEGDSLLVFLYGQPVLQYFMKIKGINSEGELITKFKADSSFTTTKTTSGLEYVIDVVGSGDNPTDAKNVTVKYTLYDFDGNLIDQSAVNGFNFTLNQVGVISGFVEAVKLLKTGGKGKFILPSAIAYGKDGNGGKVLPYMPLYFKIELVKIN